MSDPLGPFCFEATQCPDVSLNLRGARSLVITDLVPDLMCFKNKPPPSVHQRGFETETRKQRFEA